MLGRDEFFHPKNSVRNWCSESVVTPIIYIERFVIISCSNLITSFVFRQVGALMQKCVMDLYHHDLLI